MNKQEHETIRRMVRYAADIYHSNHPLCFESEAVDNREYDALIEYVTGKIADVEELSQYCNISALTYIDVVYKLMRENKKFCDDIMYGGEDEEDMDVFLQAISDKYDDLGRHLASAFGDDD